MKAAVVLPHWNTAPSGGRRGLHYIARELRDHLGVDAVSVGLPYQYEDIGDTVIDPDDFRPDADTAMIFPEGYLPGQAGAYYKAWVEDFDHGPVILYCQNAGMLDPRQPWETHFWGLGETHNAVFRAKAGIPEDVPISPLLQPVDAVWWDPMRRFGLKMPGSIAYILTRGYGILRGVAERCGSRPVFRIAGASAEEVRGILTQADIFVLASAFEGQSCILNEAMAMECACVTWPSCGLLDIVENEKTALLVEQNDVIGLVDAVKRLQGDPELARELGKNAREWVKENLSWERFRSDLAAAWSTVQTPRNAPSAKDKG